MTTQLAVLFILKRSDGPPISKISKTLAMGKSSLTELIYRMCNRGLVRRSASQTDGRVRNVYLQSPGRDVPDRGTQQTKQFSKALLAPFSAKEQRFLGDLAENADTITNGENPAEGEAEIGR